MVGGPHGLNPEGPGRTSTGGLGPGAGTGMPCNMLGAIGMILVLNVNQCYFKCY